MKKTKLLILFALICSLKLFSQDVFVDSMKQSIAHAGQDSDRISAQIGLADYYFYNLLDNDSCFILLDEAQKLAQQKGLAHKAAETMYWRALFTFSNLRQSASPKVILDGLAFARQHNFKDVEADMLILLSHSIKQQKDSAKLLAGQALMLANEYHLPAQRASGLVQMGTLYAGTNADTARKLFSEGLTIIKQQGSIPVAIRLTRLVALSWNALRQPDTALFYMRQALALARENGLVNQELYVLPIFTSTESGFFIRDSLDSYATRIRDLLRDYKRDSLVFLSRYIQSSQDIGNYNAALQAGLQLLHIGEAKKDSAIIQRAAYSLGLSYEYSFDYRKAILYLHKARLLGKWDEFSYTFTLDDLSRCYLELKQNDSAKYYAAAAYNSGVHFFGGEATLYGGLLNDLGVIYFRLGEDSLALNYLRRSYHDFTVNRVEYYNYATTTSALATYFDKHGPADSLLYYARLCLNVAREHGFLKHITDASSLMADYYSRRKNTDSAYYYQQIGFEAYRKLYSYESSREFQNMVNAEQQREEEVALAKKAAADKYASSLKQYGLITALVVAIVIGLIIYRNNRQRQKSYTMLEKQKQEIDLQKSKLETSFNELKSTQAQLIQSEKMASLGELTAGIAHEIQNPLNFVNNFSDVNKELLVELKEEADKGNFDEVKAIANDVIENSQKINHHGKRADAIVKGMLQHSRTSANQKEPTDINALADEYLRLAYHGLRAKDNSFNATMKTDLDKTIGNVNIIPQDIGRVLLNLYNNAFYAVNEKLKTTDENYRPEVEIETRKEGNRISITVCDNGNGIPQNAVDKIFQPFFTTKPTGQGTGLGLSLSYDIIKAHGGEIKVVSKEGEFTEFVIQLPISI